MLKTILPLSAIALCLVPTIAGAQARAAITSLPSGFNLPHGMGAISISGLYGPRHVGRFDGDMGMALGFGDPVDGIGFAVSADITSLENDFADSGYFNVSAHRRFSGNGGYGSVNATISGLGAFGSASARQVGGSVVVSWVSGTAGLPYMITAGIANDITLTQEVQGILGFGLGLSDQWAVSAGINGNNNSLSVTYFPSFLSNSAVQVSLRNLGDSTRRGIGIDVGYAFNLFGD